MGNGTERVKGKATEIKGAVKATVGDLTHNDQLHAEGHAEQAEGQSRQELAKAKERVKGASEEVTGETKHAVGTLTGDDHLEAEGEAEAQKGKARQGLNK
ncbi:CsbD family protein [Chloroflexales bacterium ZM16-3]|nr:CsbD family protein [Chloroflexales bacterium ZM16-3]